MNKLNGVADITIGVCIGSIITAILRSNGIEIDENMTPYIGMLVIALLARLGIKLKTPPKSD